MVPAPTESVVTSETYSHSDVVGHVHNVHRGDPPDGHLPHGALLIHNSVPPVPSATGIGGRRRAATIHTIGAALMGRLRQVYIAGNHLALLSSHQEPRCGGACMIGDSITGGGTNPGNHQGRNPPALPLRHPRAVRAAPRQLHRCLQISPSGSRHFRGLTLYEFICKAWTSQPKLFNANPLHQMLRLNI